MSAEEATNGDDISRDQSKDNPYEPKEKPKLIRVLTVLAYMLSVSMAAILLSVYYVFVWDGHPHLGSLTQEKPIENGTSLKNLWIDDHKTTIIPTSTLINSTTLGM